MGRKSGAVRAAESCTEHCKNGKQKAFEAVPETQNQRLFKSQYVNNSIHVYYTILAVTSQIF
jgi:hypothetical protein